MDLANQTELAHNFPIQNRSIFEMDAESFMNEIVDTTIKDFENHPRSRRHAFLACVATFHTIDYIVQSKSSGNRRKSFGKESPEFLLIDRVAHAFKHAKTGSAQSVSPLKVDDVIERPPAVYDTAVRGLSRWDDSVGGTTIRDDHERDILIAVRRAADFLRGQISSSDP